MDLKAYLTPLLKYWWLLLAAAMVAAISSFLVTRQQPPIYQARSTLLVGQAVSNPNVTEQELYLSDQLSYMYADLVNREPVRKGTMTSLGLTWLPEYASRPLPNTPLLEIAVTDNDPVRAAAVANELANQLILQAPTNRQTDSPVDMEFINERLGRLQEKIKNTEAEIEKKQEEMDSLTSAMAISNAQQEIALLGTLLNTYESTYANMLSGIGEGSANTLSVFEAAQPPQNPIGPNKGMIILMSSAIALTIAAGAAYLLEYLDDTLKSPEEITKLLNLPVIGYLSEMGRNSPEGVYVAKQPRSIIAEAYRSLRTNLEFVDVAESLKTLFVTSPGVGEGKTSVASNLAIVMAQGGKKVILIDADLRKPSLHKSLDIPNREGLSDIFRGRAELASVIKTWGEEKIRVISSGALPPNPADLLGSKKMDLLLDELGEQADIVIIDGPPFLVADASVLASKVDGVLLVIRYGYTRRGAAQAAMEQIKRSGARVVGVALNWVPRAQDGYIGRYRYYNSVYGSDGNQEASESKNGRKTGWRLPGRKKAVKSETEKPN